LSKCHRPNYPFDLQENGTPEPKPQSVQTAAEDFAESELFVCKASEAGIRHPLTEEHFQW